LPFLILQNQTCRLGYVHTPLHNSKAT
jgi:hypothetical protein